MSKVFTIAEGLENLGALRTGGQGSVYKGRRMGPIISAVKLLPTPIHTESTDDKNYRNFLNEVEKLKKVNEIPNPNVVKILNSGITESGSFPFIEMEFIDGPDLEELLKPPHEKIFTIKEVIKLADQLASALAHCHKVGVRHGDIKSNNVKFNIHSGNYVLLDFGLSVMSDEQRRSSIRHAGAIEFMAPEQNDGQMLMQTDIYSYGVIIYELLAGQVPFPLHDNGETSRNTVMMSHMETPVPDIIGLRKKNMPESWPKEKQDYELQVPLWLLKLVAKCLEKSPQGRYKNGMELQAAIVYNSIVEIRNEITPVTKAPVKQELEHIAPLSNPSNQDSLNYSGMMHLSKSLFTGLIILLVCSFGYIGYSFLHQSKPKVMPLATAQPRDSVPARDTTDNNYTEPEQKTNTDYLDKQQVADSTKRSIQEQIEKARQSVLPQQDSTTADTVKNNP
ncbi:serine/threonine-protein kinase [Mucilaginibacter agri]|uniref:Protein kinase n=1 Tax=Mucilaginibacter agri TaxID=2695265 RepID=A0A965ZKL9_9SPHI|nr:serine/threonine-protein kinase [Mucilaginibacter agri]NCD72425.1 protein kinase [Mucilaginibacter agri]